MSCSPSWASREGRLRAIKKLDSCLSRQIILSESCLPSCAISFRAMGLFETVLSLSASGVVVHRRCLAANQEAFLPTRQTNKSAIPFAWIMMQPSPHSSHFGRTLHGCFCSACATTTRLSWDNPNSTVLLCLFPSISIILLHSSHSFLPGDSFRPRSSHFRQHTVPFSYLMLS